MIGSFRLDIALTRDACQAEAELLRARILRDREALHRGQAALRENLARLDRLQRLLIALNEVDRDAPQTALDRLVPMGVAQ